MAFGAALEKLKHQGIVPLDLAEELKRFNRVINIRAKHFGTYAPTDLLEERTFSPGEAVYAMLIMRKLSIRLFSILRDNGTPMSAEWPDFNEKWLSRFDKARV